MVTELFYTPYILVSIPGLIFVIGILLFLFVSANKGTYAYISLLPCCYSLHISRATSVLHEVNS